jgi:hypothetical protein
LLMIKEIKYSKIRVVTWFFILKNASKINHYKSSLSFFYFCFHSIVIFFLFIEFANLFNFLKLVVWIDKIAK